MAKIKQTVEDQMRLKDETTAPTLGRERVFYSSSQKNGEVFVLFRPVETEVNRPFPIHNNETGQAEADATERAVDYSNHS